MNSERVVTAKNQAVPNLAEQSFLRGVMEEANHQGMSAEAKGRLIVIALRAYEGR